MVLPFHGTDINITKESLNKDGFTYVDISAVELLTIFV
jgi:hypothetical protein